MSPYIETRTGKAFWPLSPKVEDIDIEDIAHALSNQCRFSGHTGEHYSVDEHCVRVSWLVEDWGFSLLDQLWGLLHDASEAYLVDLPAPLKNDPEIGGPYKKAEARLMAAICKKFGLPERQPECVSAADGVLLATEARDLMAYNPEHWAKLTHEPLEGTIYPWGPSAAKREFLERFYSLTRQIREQGTPAPEAKRWPSGDLADLLDEGSPTTPPELAPAIVEPISSGPWVEGRTLVGQVIEVLPPESEDPPTICRARVEVGKPTNPKDQAAIAKIPLALCSPIAHAHWALGQYAGLCKYGAWNWRIAGVRMSVYLHAIGRHLDGILSGEVVDPVDGTDHFGNIMACCAIVLDARAAGKLTDDRPPVIPGFRETYKGLEELMKKLQTQYAHLAPYHYTIADTESAK